MRSLQHVAAGFLLISITTAVVGKTIRASASGEGSSLKSLAIEKKKSSNSTDKENDNFKNFDTEQIKFFVEEAHDSDVSREKQTAKPSEGNVGNGKKNEEPARSGTDIVSEGAHPKRENIDSEDIRPKLDFEKLDEIIKENKNSNEQKIVKAEEINVEVMEIKQDDTENESGAVKPAPGNMHLEKPNHTKINEFLSDPSPVKVDYRGVKVLRVIIQNKEQKKMIKQLESRGDISTWMGNGTAIDILIRQNNTLDEFKEKKLLYDVVIEDLQRAIEEENPPLSEDEWSELEGRKGHRMTWQMYHRMADIYGYVDYLATTYPKVCSQEIIGYSNEKKPLKVLKISSGKQDSKALWVDSGIHAREWITPATLTYIVNQMVEEGDGTHGVDWYFMPLVNPDGYEHSHTVDRLWRKNRSNTYKGPCAGTDLNRNFGYRWGGQGSSQQPCRETYAGTGPFSEPETDAIKNFVLTKSKDIKGYVSLHSYGQYILYPWGYDRKVPPDYPDLHRVGRAMANAIKNSGGQTYKVGSAAATLYPAAGGSDDWAKGTAKIKYAYTIELRDTGRYGFILPAQYIQPTAREAYAALKVLAKELTNL